MTDSVLKRICLCICIFSASCLSGCGFLNEQKDDRFDVYERSNNNKVLFMHKGFQDADKALEEARQANKDVQCPEEFYALKELKDKAYRTYWEHRTPESLDMIQEVLEGIKKLCPPEDIPVTLFSPPPSLKPLPPPPPIPLKIIRRLTLKANFYFDKVIFIEGDEAALRKAIQHLRGNPNNRVIIEGHTCDIGPEIYNQDLSERRAQAAKDFLMQEGKIPESKIIAIGYGEQRPYISNDTRAGRAMNRRVEMIIVPE